MMGVGAVLAVGLFVQGSKFRVPSSKLFTSHATRLATLLLLLAAFVLCGFGLIKSYSRGAWLGTAIGLGFLLWKISRLPSKPSRTTHHASRNYLFPLSVFLLSAFVLCFWQFRHTEIPIARRIFSVGNPNDFSWRNRVATWGGAVTMMADRPLAGHGWGSAEQVFREKYKPGHLEDAAAIQMNDYLMLGISCGVPALVCLLIYIALTGWRVACEIPKTSERHLTPALSMNAGSAGVSPAARLAATRRRDASAPRHHAPVQGFNARTLFWGILSPNEAEREAEPSTINFQPSTVAIAGAIVVMIGFWFDGGLFKLATCSVFWLLMELAQGESLTTKHTKHTKSGHGMFSPFFRVIRVFRGSIQSETDRASLRCHLPLDKWQMSLRVVAGSVVIWAAGVTALHLGTPQLAVSERTLSIARKYLVQQKQKNDFEFLAAKPIWSGQRLKTLLTHVELANYNRELVNWKLEDQVYREFVLSPEIVPSPGLPATLSPLSRDTPHPASGHLLPNAEKGTEAESESALSTIHIQPSSNLDWRRELWENFYPRIRKESSLEAAAETVGRHLRARITLNQRPKSTVLSPQSGVQSPQSESGESITGIWRRQVADEKGFEAVYVAVLRSVGIPSRLDAQGRAEFWNGTEWKPAPKPAELGVGPTQREN
jgi:hypothetical protein